MDPLLRVDNLQTEFRLPEKTVRAVNGVTFEVGRGEIVGIVGESGSGKSVTARSIVGLEEPGEIVGGTVTFDGTELTEADRTTKRRIRGSGISMLFQDPGASLNPVLTVGEQILEAATLTHDGPAKSLPAAFGFQSFRRRPLWSDARNEAIGLLERVGIADAERRIDDYPHEFSGGMRQRVMLAVALAANPTLLLADEPTTALDTTTQAQLLDLLADLSEIEEMSIVLISHDLGVVSEICDRVVVLYGGEVMESGPTERVLNNPRHPYTHGLLRCRIDANHSGTKLPTIDGTVPDRFDSRGCPFASRCSYATTECNTTEPPVTTVESTHHVKCSELDSVPDLDAHPTGSNEDQGFDSGTKSLVNDDSVTDPVVRFENVSKEYETNQSVLESVLSGREQLTAVNDVSFVVRPGETLGIVGESGSGKSTIAELMTGLSGLTSGTIRLNGQPVGIAEDRSHDQLNDVGMVFQDARSSCNPRLRVRELVAEPLIEAGWAQSEQWDRVREVLEWVELGPEHADRRPHQLSGGQLQRVALARAMALEPELVVLDEPVSGLDVSIQATVCNLLLELQEQSGQSFVIISHDLKVVSHLADRILVTYLGEIVERGAAESLRDSPAHPYTAALFDAVPTIDGTSGFEPLEGAVPSPIDRPDGCSFHTRCPMVESKCQTESPDWQQVKGTQSRCHFAESVAGEASPDVDGLGNDVDE
ncbi:dipeptide ABC transporter ATP-binding protein [Natrialba swarupiae]|uniref:Nickel import system ATP-binding protein NikD n=1 Tax=Natrialba swarupiae TaxID=2448032 RepID=A0A5D5AN80_9EURY|nr:ABC transporter ATP-binding protein [Natrialba swarupiae]TYT62335.1 ABC transporter ATP-binding protein [Natrialba swarupiae]